MHTFLKLGAKSLIIVTNNALTIDNTLKWQLFSDILNIKLHENYHDLGTFYCNVIKEISQTSCALRHPLHLSYSAYISSIG